jgi:DNA-binding NarL/FixJ family response regulator
MGAKRTVLLVDDHPVVCVGVRLFLESSAQFEVCGEAGDVATARRLVEQLQPDLMVLDLVLGGRDGIELVEELAILHPPVRILIYSSQDEMQYARRALRAGARGYLMKSAGLEAVGEALAALARGENSVSAMVQRSLVQDLVGHKKKALSSPLEDLSDRELQIFRLLGTGLGSAEIAVELALSIKTVGTYRERLKNKLNLETGRDLERHAENYIRQGIGR